MAYCRNLDDIFVVNPYQFPVGEDGKVREDFQIYLEKLNQKEPKKEIKKAITLREKQKKNIPITYTKQDENWLTFEQMLLKLGVQKKDSHPYETAWKAITASAKLAIGEEGEHEGIYVRRGEDGELRINKMGGLRLLRALEEKRAQNNISKKV